MEFLELDVLRDQLKPNNSAERQVLIRNIGKLIVDLETRIQESQREVDEIRELLRSL